MRGLNDKNVNEYISPIFLFSCVSGSSVAVYQCVEINGQQSIILKLSIHSSLDN